MRRQMAHRAGAHRTRDPRGARRFIGPAILGVLGIDQPKEMTGHDLRLKKQ